MPKAAVAQTGFTTGEVSPLCYGVFDNPRYKKGLAIGLNYIPTLQGPVIRRPGTKYMAAVKDAANPPILVPFKFSETQQYMLEFGDQYIRFFSPTGQLVTVGTSYKLQGTMGDSGLLTIGTHAFYATRADANPQPYETINSSSSPSPGAILELQSPYLVADLSQLRWRQSGDTMYLVHPRYAPMKLQRQSNTAWKLQTVYVLDGPYLPANSFQSVGDSIGTTLAPISTSLIGVNVKVNDVGGTITNAVSSGGKIQITTTTAHGLVSGQKVFIYGVGGTTEANNFSNVFGRTNSTGPGYWVISVTSTTSFILLGSTFVNAFTAGGNVAPALFALSAAQVKAGSYVQDIGRLLALQVGSKRYWGSIQTIFDAVTVAQRMGGTDISSPVTYPATTTADSWFLGVWSGQGTTAANFNGFGYPSCVELHQNRLWFGGVANSPLEVDASAADSFENFAASKAADLTVTDANALSFVLTGRTFDALRWMQSTAQGLCAGSASAEWVMTPSGTSEALTSTNFNAQETSFYGSAPLAPTKIGNAVMYVQSAFRKLREMAFAFTAGTFRSEDLTEISEHITLPTLNKIEVQKENQPLVWGVRGDGALTSMVYNRNDVSLSAGWMRHLLGGYSDSGGTAPVVLDIGIIKDASVTFDQPWLVVKRWINSAAVCYVEMMSKISDDSIRADDSVQFDCAGTYDSPKTITALTVANPAVLTSAAHGFSNGDTVKIVKVVGLNKSSTDIDGKVTVTNLVNEKTFLVASAAANTFALHDMQGNAVDSSTYGAWVSGGEVRKLVSTISGITWLEGETVGVLADGGIHPDVTVSGGGAVVLQFPAAKVQLGYRYKSQGQLLRAEAGAADGTSIGKTRRTTRAALQLHRVGDMAIGTSFDNLIPIQLGQADYQFADTAQPLYSGMVREGVESAYDFESQLCFEQSSGLPGTVQSITTFMEEQDL